MRTSLFGDAGLWGGRKPLLFDGGGDLKASGEDQFDGSGDLFNGDGGDKFDGGGGNLFDGDVPFSDGRAYSVSIADLFFCAGGDLHSLAAPPFLSAAAAET